MISQVRLDDLKTCLNYCMKQRNEIGEDEQYDNDDRVETPRKRKHDAEEIQG